jgi:hypothetical protein
MIGTESRGVLAGTAGAGVVALARVNTMPPRGTAIINVAKARSGRRFIISAVRHLL